MDDLQIRGYCKLIGGKLIQDGICLLESDAPFAAFLDQVVKQFSVQHPRFGKLDRLAQLAYACTEILINKLKSQNINLTEETSLLFMNASSSLDTDLRFDKSIQSMASPSLFVYTLPNILLAEICIKNGLKGENTFLVAEKPDPELYLLQIQRIFRDQTTHICIAGWAEILDENYDCSVFLIDRIKAGAKSSTPLNISSLNKILS
ncbi:MAG: hypothetical protein HXX13_03705 [Bacteroidetes bacterium]|nr:hypothetical protein [Bacteroidota bacterium]